MPKIPVASCALTPHGKLIDDRSAIDTRPLQMQDTISYSKISAQDDILDVNKSTVTRGLEAPNRLFNLQNQR
jgi:hypothetical protein